ncbi:MAG TPA: TlpA disulfide reductase family protein [Vicinamibacterales bacterium]|nr:TlpA disulfide reductase family protein [Vicinamibacterales bacterium]
MTVRWLIAGVAAVGVGVLAIPFLMGRGDHAGVSEPEMMASHATGKSCSAEGKGKLDAFTVKDMNGAEVRLADFKGKAILLNYWATWCGPCKIEIPAFVELYDKYKDQGFVILGVSTDDDPATLREYASELKMNYPVLVGRDHDDLLEAFGPVWGLPTSFFIGRDGSVCGKHLGPATKERFEQEIKALL